jgi:hypothetical protein
LRNPENPTDPENEVSDFLDPDGSEEISGNPENMADFIENKRNPENPENPEYVNVNVNDNVNVTRVSSNEETLETISLEELNRMGAEYTLDDEGVATFSTGYKVKVKFDF